MEARLTRKTLMTQQFIFLGKHLFGEAKAKVGMMREIVHKTRTIKFLGWPCDPARTNKPKKKKGHLIFNLKF